MLVATAYAALARHESVEIFRRRIDARTEIKLAAGAELMVVGKRDKIQRFDRECGEPG